MDKVSISVIVPIYNVESQVSGCLTSIRNQTFGDFEVICIDDGSTDNSGRIAADFCTKDSRFCLIHQKNKGLSGARNAGLNTARGTYVCFVDSDDYLHPQALEILYTAIREQKTDIANMQIIKTAETYPSSFPVLNKPYSAAQLITDPFMAFLSRRDVMTSVCSRLYKKTILDSVRFIEGIYFEDVPFTIQVMATAHSLSFIPLNLYYYYANPTSIMRSSFTTQKLASYITVIRSVFDYIQANRPADLPAVRRAVLNKRVKMMMNQAVRKQKDKAVRRRLFREMQTQLSALYTAGIISYDGLKLHHKIALFLLLHDRPNVACRWMSLF